MHDIEDDNDWDASGQNTSDYTIVPLSPTVYTIIGVYLTIIGTVAATGNIIVFYTTVRCKELMKKPQQLFILNLAIADFGICCSGYPLIASSNYAHRWIYGDTACVINGFVCTLFSLVDINTLLVLSVYRYIMICKPHYGYLLRKKRLCYACIAFTWIHSGFWSLSVFTGWTEYRIELFGTSCSIDMITPSVGVISYNILITVFEYVLPLVVISFSFTMILLRYKDVKIQIRESLHSLNVHEMNLIYKMYVEHNITLMMFLMVTVFFVVWTPYTLVCLWTAFDYNSLPIGMAVTPTMFAKIGCMMNPIIYSIANKTFRGNVLRLLRGCCSSQSQNTDNHSRAETLERINTIVRLSPDENRVVSVF